MHRAACVATAVLLWVVVAVGSSTTTALARTFSPDELICAANAVYGEAGKVKARREELVVIANSILNRALAESGWYRFVDWGGPSVCHIVRWRIGKRKRTCQYEIYCKGMGWLAGLLGRFSQLVNVVVPYPDELFIPGEALPGPVTEDHLWKRSYDVVVAVFVNGERAHGDLRTADTYQFWCLEPKAYNAECEEGKRKRVKTKQKTKCWFALALKPTQTQLPEGRRIHYYYRVKSPSEVYDELSDPEEYTPPECKGFEGADQYVKDVRDEQLYRLTHPAPSAPPKKPIVEPEERRERKTLVGGQNKSRAKESIGKAHSGKGKKAERKHRVPKNKVGAKKKKHRK